MKRLLVRKGGFGSCGFLLQFRHFAVWGGLMTVISHTKSCLTHKLGTVGCLDSHIFILCLVNLFMGVANRHICPCLNRPHGKGAFYMSLPGFHLLFKSQAFLCLSCSRIRECFHPQFPAGGQPRLGLLQFFRCPLCLTPGMGQLCISLLRWKFICGKFQLGSFLWLTIG